MVINREFKVHGTLNDVADYFLKTNGWFAYLDTILRSPTNKFREIPKDANGILVSVNFMGYVLNGNEEIREYNPYTQGKPVGFVHVTMADDKGNRVVVSRELKGQEEQKEQEETIVEFPIFGFYESYSACLEVLDEIRKTIRKNGEISVCDLKRIVYEKSQGSRIDCPYQFEANIHPDVMSLEYKPIYSARIDDVFVGCMIQTTISACPHMCDEAFEESVCSEALECTNDCHAGFVLETASLVVGPKAK